MAKPPFRLTRATLISDVMSHLSVDDHGRSLGVIDVVEHLGMWMSGVRHDLTKETQ